MELLFFLAYHNSLENYIKALVNERHSGYSHNFGLDSAFCWADTIEGHDYWRDLDDKFCQWVGYYDYCWGNKGLEK